MAPGSRLAIPALLLLAASCGPLPSSSSDSRLLVDRDAPRYGQIVSHGSSRTLPIVRGDGIAEFFVPVQIGTTRGWWQIDTGAAFCAVSPIVARHEGFKPIAEGQIVTAAGRVASQLGTLPSVRLGDLEIREASALSLDDEYADDFTINGQRGEVVGILGADLLDHLNATIDLRSNRLLLRSP